MWGIEPGPGRLHESLNFTSASLPRIETFNIGHKSLPIILRPYLQRTLFHDSSM